MVHASRYLDFVEDAFLRWLEDQEMSYEVLRNRSLDLVIGTSVCRYRQPARLGDHLTVTAAASRSSRSTVTVSFAVLRDEVLLASADVTYVSVQAGFTAALPSRLAADPRAAVEARTPQEILDALHSAQAHFYAGGDESALADVMHPGVVWTIPGPNDIAGQYRGRDQVIAYMVRRRELSQKTFRMQPRELLVGTEHFASITDGTATIGGVEHKWSTIGLYRSEQNRIIECSLIAFDQAAFDRAWTLGS